eukprot:gene2998-4717_t
MPDDVELQDMDELSQLDPNDGSESQGGYQGLVDEEQDREGSRRNSSEQIQPASPALREWVHEPWSQRLHHVMVGTTAFSSVLLIMILASRSWGVGQDRTVALSAGLWWVCLTDYARQPEPEHCKRWSDFCPPAEGAVSTAATCCLLALAVSIFMLVVDAFEMVRPAAFRLHHTTMLLLNHCLWAFCLLSFLVFVGAMHTFCGEGVWLIKVDHTAFSPKDHVWYAWGWMFLLWMFIVHTVTAALLSWKHW